MGRLLLAASYVVVQVLNFPDAGSAGYRNESKNQYEA